MRDRVLRADADSYVGDDDRSGRDAPRWRRFVRERPLDALASAVAAFGVGAILVNALFLQTGRHPAPMFANKLPEPAPVAAAPKTPATPAQPKPRTDLMADIQRELSKRGFYDGPADGVYGPKTDTAIRDFEEAAGLRPSAQPNDALLRTIIQSGLRKQAAPAARHDPIADLLAPNSRILAVQRALSAYGYGQIRATGVYDLDTREAIEQFERERKLPLTGKISDRLVREIATMTGRPLD